MLPLPKMKLLLPLSFFLLTFFFSATNSTPFTCTEKSACQSLIGYTSPNVTTLSHIKTLFNVNSMRAFLSANSLPLNTPLSYQFPPNSTVRIRFACHCTANGTGVPSRPPMYKVKTGDGLDYIARTVFGRLVTYQEIAAFNNITNPNLIETGQELKIPLPCGCDEVDGMKVVHFGLVVQMGATLGGIGDRFGVDEKVLLEVNGLKDPKELMAGLPLDVPLKACSSSISNTSRDNNLLVPNGSYVFTANNCIQCSCSSMSWQLDCRPTQMIQLSASCPAAKCGSLFIGNTTTTSVCDSSICAYDGYTKNNTILAKLIPQPQPLCNNGVPISQPTSGSDGSFNQGGILIFLKTMLILLVGVL